MNRFLSVLLLCMWPALCSAEVASEPETAFETAILDTAIAQCRNTSPENVDREMLLHILRLEEEFQVPHQLRGMILAAACVESGYRPDCGGDHRFSKNKRTPKAIGILQQWPWWEKRFSISRKNPYQASKAWLSHLVSRVPKVSDRCSFKSHQVDQIWRTAWVTAVRAPSPRPRCHQVSQHWTLFVQWRSQWVEHIEVALND